MSASNCGCDPEENDYKCERHREMSELTDVGAGYENNGGPNELTLNEYQRSLHTYKDRHHECHALGLSGELAEVFDELARARDAAIAAGNVADMVKKATAHGVPLDRAKLKKELGDVLWYITAVASDNELPLADIAVANIEKLRARYPEGFVKGGGVREDALHNVVRQEPFLADVSGGKYEERLTNTEIPAVLCAHANECPRTCPCPPNCYCRRVGSAPACKSRTLLDTARALSYGVAFACGCKETTDADGTRRRAYCANGECRRLAR